MSVYAPLKYDNTINWPLVVWPAISAVSPNTGKQREEKLAGAKSHGPAGHRVQLAQSPVKPRKLEHNADRHFFPFPSDSATNKEMALLVTFHMIVPSLTLSQLSMGVTPGLPVSPFSPLAPAMPGTPGSPWEQPSPQLPWRKTHTNSLHAQKWAKWSGKGWKITGYN